MKKLFKKEKFKYIFLGSISGAAVGLFLLGGIFFVTKVLNSERFGKIRNTIDEKLAPPAPKNNNHFGFSFETAHENDLFHNNDGLTTLLSTEHATDGAHSLRLDYPAGNQYPGLEMEVFGKDSFSWNKDEVFAVDVFNDSNMATKLIVKIKSGRNYPKRSFESSFTVNPRTQQTLRIPVKDMAGHLDSRFISYLNLYMVTPSQTARLYVDNIRIEKVGDLDGAGLSLLKKEDAKLILNIYPKQRLSTGIAQFNNASDLSQLMPYFGDTVIKSALIGNIADVSAYTSGFGQEDKIAVILINKHADKNFDVNINLDQVAPKQEGRAWVLSLEQKSIGSLPKKYTVKDIKPSFMYIAPAHSVSLIQIDLMDNTQKAAHAQ
jgi:hypothetical protein